MKKAFHLKMINFWPPFLGAGIRLTKVASDYRSIEVEMKLRFWNTNYVGTHFGGSLYTMTDPFFMFMVIENLGRDYIVWDKAATIRFKNPGKGRVTAKFAISAEKIQEIREAADRDGRTTPVFQVNVVDDDGTIVAEVEKTLSVRRKDRVKQKTTEL
jgi:acyl-coenzyme A thioesterase PaaI-like protein